MITVSIVSHGHGVLVEGVVRAVLACSEVAEIILTRNIPERLVLPDDPRIRIVDNLVPKGFGANQNTAFALSEQAFFCPLNPDISWADNPFPALLAVVRQTGAALVAPLVLAPDGLIEDSIRRFPNFLRLLGKACGGTGGRYALHVGAAVFEPDWVAGMFMLFRREDFARLQGFDPRFFLYYEDVDICLRAGLLGMQILVNPSVTVVHDARRASRKNLQHMRWHLASMALYFRKIWGGSAQLKKREKIPGND